MLAQAPVQSFPSGGAALVSMSQIWDNACLKNVLFHPKALEEFRELPKSIRIAFGESLRLLQEGVTLGMPASRPMPSIAPGVDELRAKEPSGQYRAFYLKKSRAGILILRAFHKKTQETPKSEIRLAQTRLQELIDDNG
jgi:phage-related protein